jgi:Ca2+-transporting ATPase
MPLPLLAIHLLWVNLTTDGLPALALAVDPKDPDTMERPPRNPNSSIFTKNVMIIIAVIAVTMTATMLTAFVWKLRENGLPVNSSNPLLPEAQTMVLCTMVMFELFAALACRSEIHSYFKLGVFSNRWLILSILSSLALLFAVIYIPPLRGPFHVVPMAAEDWLFIIPISLTGFTAIEIVKWIMRLRSRARRSRSA